MTRLGYQIPNFTYPGKDPAQIFPMLIEQAQAAEAAGFDRVLLMDHFYQLPGIGNPDDYMLECYTTLAALAQHTKSVRLSALVTGNTYRNPAILAKIITTLDHVSNGRASLGIGSGWFEMEHDAFGIAFNSFSERFEKLEEALQIIVPMLADERPTLAGKHYNVTGAINSPAPLSNIPIMIGGAGEKKTLRMVAQYAQESNLICANDEIPRKLDALAAHCERLGRDRSEIKVTKLLMTLIGETMEQAEQYLVDYIANHGWPAEIIDGVRPQLLMGDPESIAAEMVALKEAGLDGVTLNLVASAHDVSSIALAGEVVGSVFG